MLIMILFCLCVISFGSDVEAGSKIVFPDDPVLRQGREIDTGLAPPILPHIDHLENDPSTLLPNETKLITSPTANGPKRNGNENTVGAKFGFSHGFDVSPNADGGLTATFSHRVAGTAGNSQTASQSVSFGFNNGFQASQSSSQSNSFNNGLIRSSFSGSQANSQSSSNSAGLNGLSSSAAFATAPNNFGGSLAAGSSFGSSFNEAASSRSHSSFATLNTLKPLNNILNSLISGNIDTDITYNSVNFGEGDIDISHRGVNNYPQQGQNSIVETSIIYPLKPLRRQSNYGSVVVPSNIDRWRPSVNNPKNNDEIFIVEF